MTEAASAQPSGARIYQAHIVDGILNAATEVFAERGRHASMADVAVAAGLSRSTLYRYYPNREKLLAALYETALRETIERVRQAGLDSVPVEEGISRLARALISVGNRYLVLIGEVTPSGESVLELKTEGPIADLFARGQAEGLLRSDIPTQTLELQFANLVVGTLRGAGQLPPGDEYAAALVVDLFLNGAREKAEVGRKTSRRESRKRS